MALRTNIEIDPITQADQIEIAPNRLRAGTRMLRYDRPNLYRLLYSHGERLCRAPSPDNAWYCSRPAGHPAHWRHVAASDYEVYTLWGGSETPPGEFIDPPDGTPDDPADVTVTPELGGVYRLRDRRNILQVIDGLGTPRPDGWLDVLDLTKREYRAVPATEMVPTEYVPTIDDVMWVVQYTQKLRMTTRDEAIKLHHQQKWCRDGLQSTLADLGLPPYVPVQHGTLTVEIPYTAPLDTNTSVVKAAFEAAFGDQITAVKSHEWTNPDKIDVRLGELAVHVRNVSRS